MPIIPDETILSLSLTIITSISAFVDSVILVGSSITFSGRLFFINLFTFFLVPCFWKVNHCLGFSLLRYYHRFHFSYVVISFLIFLYTVLCTLSPIHSYLDYKPRRIVVLYIYLFTWVSLSEQT